MRGRFWRALCGQLHDLGFLGPVGGPPTAWQVCFDGRKTSLGEALAPASNLNAPDTEHFSDGAIVIPASSTMPQRRVSRTLAVCDCATFNSLVRCSPLNPITLAMRI